jgi:hypothetical protein
MEQREALTGLRWSMADQPDQRRRATGGGRGRLWSAVSSNPSGSKKTYYLVPRSDDSRGLPHQNP